MELSVSINAPTWEVWGALATQDSLRRWIPLEVALEGGVGGHISFSRGGDEERIATIVAWEPGWMLRWVESPSGGEGEGPAVEIQLDGGFGSTTVQLTLSGLPSGPEGAARALRLGHRWSCLLHHLRHWLERHPGSQRSSVEVRLPSGRPLEAAWEELMGPGSLNLAPQEEEDWSVGARVSLRLGPDPLVGRIVHVGWPSHLLLEVEALKDALLLVELEEGEGEEEGSTSSAANLSLYDVDEGMAEGLRDALDQFRQAAE